MITANNRWCEVDFLTFESIKVPKIHVLGDAIQIAPLMPKSGHMANQHAKVAAAAILNAFAGQAPNPTPAINNTCYSFITDKDVVHVASVHQYDKEKKTFATVPGSGGLSPAPIRARGRVRVRVGAEHLGGHADVEPAGARVAQRDRVPGATQNGNGAPKAPFPFALPLAQATAARRLRDRFRLLRRLLERELHLLVLAHVDRHLAAGRRGARTAARRRAPCGSCPG